MLLVWTATICMPSALLASVFPDVVSPLHTCSVFHRALADLTLTFQSCCAFPMAFELWPRFSLLPSQLSYFWLTFNFSVLSISIIYSWKFHLTSLDSESLLIHSIIFSFSFIMVFIPLYHRYLFNCLSD